jgi:hypothetical protein
MLYTDATFDRVKPRDAESYFKVMEALVDPDRRDWAERQAQRDTTSQL